MVAKKGLIFEGKCIFENKPPPQSRSCLLLKKGGLIFGRIRYQHNYYNKKRQQKCVVLYFLINVSHDHHYVNIIVAE